MSSWAYCVKKCPDESYVSRQSISSSSVNSYNANILSSRKSKAYFFNANLKLLMFANDNELDFEHLT